MEGFDDGGIFYSDNFIGDGGQQNDNQINMQEIKKKYKEFIRTYHEENFHYKYR